MISFEDIQIKYGNTIIIDHLDLKINTGEFFTFLGGIGMRENDNPACACRIPYTFQGVIYWWTERVS